MTRLLEARIVADLRRCWPLATVERKRGVLTLAGAAPPLALRLWLIVAHDDASSALEHLDAPGDMLPVVLWQGMGQIVATARLGVLGELLGLHGRAVTQQPATVNWQALLDALRAWRGPEAA